MVETLDSSSCFDAHNLLSKGKKCHTVKACGACLASFQP